jgi:hypothetical protein
VKPRKGGDTNGTARADHAAERLVDLAAAGDHDGFARLACQVLGSGRVQDLAAALRSRPAGPRPLRIRLLDADLATRDQSIELHELVELEQLTRASGEDGLVVWITAILAEWGLWRGDFATFGYVFRSPAAVADDPLTRLAEARRRRIALLASLVADPDDPRVAGELAEVRTLLESCGCAEELAMTDCILGYGRLSISDDLSPEPIEVIRRGVKELERLEADRLPVGLAFLAWSSYMCGDFVSCADALDRYEEVRGQSGPQPPVVVEGVAILHELAEMIVDGATAEIRSSLRDHFERLRRATVPTWFVGPVANDLLDHGCTDLAEEVSEAAASVPSVMRAAHQSLQEVDARLRILRDHDPAAVEDLWALYGEWEAVGRGRRAAASALRCSWTCRHAGLQAAADRLAAWGEERLPPPDERTPWEERYLAGSLGGEAPSRASRGTLRVLVPDVTVCQGEREVRLGDMQARLMAVLAAARRPVTTDWVVTALWPEADLEAGRNRLAALVHRIRQRLGLVPDELLRRTRHGLELDGRGWSIDVWNFWDLSAGSPEEQERAIDLYRSDLAGRQLAYDDLLEEQRELLRQRWVDTVRSLVERGHLSAQDAMARAHRVGTFLVLE